MIIDGTAIAEKVKEEIKKEIAEKKLDLGLAVLLVGEDPASQIYVKYKEKACEVCGIHSKKIVLPENTTKEEIIKEINKLNKDKKIHGILVQLPLPKHLNEFEILEHIPPEKDVDGFTSTNTGRLLLGEKPFAVSCTPQGIMHLIKSTGVEIKGKQAVVVGRSKIVGKPVALLLLQEHATVTIAHSRTKDLDKVCAQADILVAAVGKAKLIKKEFVKKGAVVIDVGMNRAEGKLCGDVDFDEVKDIAGWITPVPKGVGPMTIAYLLKNVLDLSKK
ncbi:bifunctional methylenetetrahydrofolate dehydrogenase/methenyltetrahydrofolate cyclohydrolase FolD [Candidatus Margulisiibacteriota bacterium]